MVFYVLYNNFYDALSKYYAFDYDIKNMVV